MTRLFRILALPSTAAALVAFCLSACGGGGGGSSPAPQPTSAIPVVHVVETPLPADALADSVGINTHVNVYGSAPDFGTIVGREKGLGARHIRDGILDADAAFDSAMTQLLVAGNAKLDGITDCAGIEILPTSPTSPAQIEAFDAAIGNRLEAVESPDDVDNRSDTNWVADTLACLPSLRTAEPALPFYAPTLFNQLADAPLLGNISADVDYGNANRYLAGRNPGSAGWGRAGACGIYGALSWALCETRLNSGTKPIVFGGTGYNSVTEVDELTQAKYISRLLLFNLQAGVRRSYLYDLKDDGGGLFPASGLIRADDSMKPAYAAVASEIAFFADPGPATSAAALSYSIQEPSSSIDHLLFVKRDGTLVLALWNETPSWNVTANEEIAVAPQEVAVTFAFAPRAVAAVSLNDAGALVAKTAATSQNTISVAVDDHVTLVSFHSI
jgi:hypothetical protein